jgi:hypothetical protein
MPGLAALNATAESVPSRVASDADTTAMKRLFRSARRTNWLVQASSYQRSEKPVSSATCRPALKLKKTTTTIGANRKM